MNIKSLSLVVVQLGHGSSELSKLSDVESLHTVSVYYTALCVHEEALHSHLTAKLVEESSSLEGFLEGIRIILVSEDKSSLEIEGIEVELFNIEGRRKVSTLVNSVGFKHFGLLRVVDDVA